MEKVEKKIKLLGHTNFDEVYMDTLKGWVKDTNEYQQCDLYNLTIPKP